MLTLEYSLGLEGMIKLLLLINIFFQFLSIHSGLDELYNFKIKLKNTCWD